MTWRLRRYYGQGSLHFITFSCYRRRPLLAKPARRDRFLGVLEEVRQQMRFAVLGYVVMPEHVHLLISEPELGDPSGAVQLLKQRTSHDFGRARRHTDERSPRFGQAKTSPNPFGNAASMTSMCSPRRNVPRRRVICTIILCGVGYALHPLTGSGAAIAGMHSVKKARCG